MFLFLQPPHLLLFRHGVFPTISTITEERNFWSQRMLCYFCECKKEKKKKMAQKKRHSQKKTINKKKRKQTIGRSVFLFCFCFFRKRKAKGQYLAPTTMLHCYYCCCCCYYCYYYHYYYCYLSSFLRVFGWDICTGNCPSRHVLFAVFYTFSPSFRNSRYNIPFSKQPKIEDSRLIIITGTVLL